MTLTDLYRTLRQRQILVWAVVYAMLSPVPGFAGRRSPAANSDTTASHDFVDASENEPRAPSRGGSRRHYRDAQDGELIDPAPAEDPADDGETPTMSQAAVTITIGTEGFEPETVNVNPGTEVVWWNATSQTQTIRSGVPTRLFRVVRRAAFYQEDYRNRPPRHGPYRWAFEGPGGEFFTTTIPSGGTYARVFDEEMTFNYFLVGNPDISGRVIVFRETPDPEFEAPPVDPTVPTDLGDSTDFLYTGDDPIQTGVDPEDIDHERVAVLRGRAVTRDGDPVAGVTVTVLDHSEFGSTRTRAEGWFDMAVNGGGQLTLKYEKSGFLPVYRSAKCPWQDFVNLDDVVLTPLDNQVTRIDFSDPVEVARGSPVTDQDGERQATLLFAQGTSAEMVLPDGSTQPLPTLTVRATEYTVGETGPKAMPAELPPSSAYTYCVELSVDEAMAANATEVRFDRPVYNYVENFLGFPVGSAVPNGTYDPHSNAWMAEENGVVVEIVGISGGRAEVDTDGDGAADDAAMLAALGFTDDERRTLAQLYQPGETLWRVPQDHFTTKDYNWPWGPPEDNVDPSNQDPLGDDTQDNDCLITHASVIECKNQVLGEMVPIAGTPFTLNYRSNRVPGRVAANTLEISLSDGTIPESLTQIILDVEVAGRRFTSTFVPEADLTHTFEWDGLDVYGRRLYGPQPVDVRTTYRYPLVYYPVATDFAYAFGRIPDETPWEYVPARMSFDMWQTWSGVIGAYDAKSQGLGGWTLDVHHAYDPRPFALDLWRGDGGRRKSRNIGEVITTLAGHLWNEGECVHNPTWNDGRSGPDACFTDVSDVAVAPDGSVYILETSYVYKVEPDGTVRHFAGLWPTPRYCLLEGEGGPAIEAHLCGPQSMALGPDGSLYIAESRTHRIRRISPDGILETVAGSGAIGDKWSLPPEEQFGGDGGPATEAALWYPSAIDVGPDGSLYIADSQNNRIRRVGPEGIITTFAGGGPRSNREYEGVPATELWLEALFSVAVGPDGTVYTTREGSLDTWCTVILGIGPDGISRKVAGVDSSARNPNDGGSALAAFLWVPSRVDIADDGTLYISSRGSQRVRYVTPDGIINTLTGTGVFNNYDPGGFSGDGGPAAAAQLQYPVGVDVSPDGDVFVADSRNGRVRRIGAPVPDATRGDLLIPSESGNETYLFNPSGRHLETLDSWTGATLYTFDHDANGLVSRVTDGDGNVTLIERNPDGNPEAIVAPFGQRTELELDADGYLARITSPADETVQFEHDADGLLRSAIDPRGNVSHYLYDDSGRLIRDEDPAGGSWTLTRTELDRGYEVERETELGRTAQCRVEHLTNGDTRDTKTYSTGAQVVREFNKDGSRTVTRPDGTVVTWTEGPDPRFGMQSPILTSWSMTTPGGLNPRLTLERSTELANPSDLMSLTRMTDTATVGDRTFTRVFDAADRSSTVTTPEGRTATIARDLQGRPVFFRIGDLEPLQFLYDNHGRLATAVAGTGDDERTLTLTYGSNGYMDTITDALGNATTFATDDSGRIVRETLPDSGSLAMSYDGNGNILTYSPPGRPAHRFDYSPVNLMERMIAPTTGTESATTVFEYDLDRNLTGVVRPDAATTSLSYDDAGRLQSLTAPHGSYAFAYDPDDSKLSGITAPGGVTLSFSYDGVLPLSETLTGPVSGTVTRTYDNDIRPVSLRVNGGHVTDFVYDDDNLLTRAGDLVIDRDAVTGLVTSSTVGGVAESRSYNRFGEIEARSVSVGGEPLYQVALARDNLGRITSRTETVEGVTDTYAYAYDSVGRLIEVRENNVLEATYGYDINDNRTGISGPGVALTATHDDQDRLTRHGDVTYEYTPNGELLTRTESGLTTYYDYDVLGSLRGVTLPDGTEIEYLIDGQGRRVGKKVDGALTRGFLYQDNLNPVAELDGAGNVVSRFVYATRDHVPDYLVKNGQAYRIVADLRGSPRLVVNAASGEIAQRLGYDAFGQVIFDTHPGFQPFGFAGGLYDPDTGLVRFGMRDYDAETGRWTARDPLSFAAGSPNLYAYVFNDPVNLIDPTGLVAPAAAAGLIFLDAGLTVMDFAALVEALGDPCSDLFEAAMIAVGALVGLGIPGVAGLGMAVRVGARGTRRAEAGAGLLRRAWDWLLRRGGAEQAVKKVDDVGDEAARFLKKLRREGFDAPPTEWSSSGGRRWNNDLSR